MVDYFYYHFIPSPKSLVVKLLEYQSTDYAKCCPSHLIESHTEISKIEAIRRRGGVHVYTNLYFVGVPSDSQGLVCPSGQGVILNHDHLHTSPLLQDDEQTLGHKGLEPTALAQHEDRRP